MKIILKSIIFIMFYLLALSVNAQTVCGDIRVTGVADGDTLRAEMAGAPSPLNRVLIRISGIDTPELKGKCKAEKEKAKESKKFLTDKFLNANFITFGTLDWDKYGGRVLADVYFDGKNVGQMMIEAGYAVTYHGEKKNPIWCLP